MTVCTMGIRGLADGILSGMRDARGGPGTALVTGSVGDARAIAGYLAAKAGAKLCPLGARVIGSPRGRDLAIECVGRLSHEGTVVLIELDGGDCDWPGLVSRLREAVAGRGNCAIIAGTDWDDVDPALAGCFDAVGSLDESGFVPHTACPGPSPRP